MTEQNTTTTLLATAKANYFETVVDIIQNYDPSEKEAFSRIVQQALEMGLSQGEIARLFDVNDSTVSRWRKGKSLPIKLIRKQVASEIGKLLAQKEIF